MGGLPSINSLASGCSCPQAHPRAGKGTGWASWFLGLCQLEGSGQEGPKHSLWGQCAGAVDRVVLSVLLPQVNNINQPLEITAISSPESSLKSSPVPYQDNDQPPVLKKEKPLNQANGAQYSPLTSDEEPGSEDEPGSAR